MSIVEDQTHHQTSAAQAWLEELEPSRLTTDLFQDYPNGPIFSDHSAPKTIEFLMLCAASERKHHVAGKQMEGLTLSIGFEYGTMEENQLDLAFTYTHPEHRGSVSHNLSVVKDNQNTFHVFGDDQYRQLI